MSGGRPEGTTLATGYNVGMSGGRPEGTTLAAGYNVGMSGGRPEGTTLDRGYHVGISSNLEVDFSDCDLSTASNWDISSMMSNMNDSLCTKLIQRINTQQAFDQQPLTK